jgi:hypothetical protein
VNKSDRSTDRPELGDRARHDDEASERRVGLPCVLEHRHHDAERGRREDHGDVLRVDDDVGDPEREGQHQADDEREAECSAAELQGTAAHLVEVELEPGQEEQEHDTQRREHVDDLVRIDEAERGRADDDPSHDLDDRAGDRHAREQREHEWDRDCEDHHEHQLVVGDRGEHGRDSRS